MVESRFKTLEAFIPIGEWVLEGDVRSDILSGQFMKCCLSCILLEVSILPLLFAAPFADEVLLDQPVGFYRLNETGGAIAFDESGFGSHGTYEGISLPVLGEAGLTADADGAVAFSGMALDASYIRIPAVVNPGETSFTLEALVQVNSLGANQIIFQQQDVNGVGRTLLRVAASGAIDSNLGGSLKLSGATVNAGVPVHIALVFEKSGESGSGEAEGTWRFYVNGEPEESGLISGASGAELSEGDFVIGIQKGLDGQYFGGLMDELAFYDKALPPERIAEHFASVSEEPLITSFTASHPAINEGGTVTLAWVLDSNVTSLILGPGIGAIQPRSGSGILAPLVTTTYTLTASDGMTTHTKSVTVKVGEEGPFRISEILADNAGPLADEDGEESDWIEIANLGELPGDLEGWYLTDDRLNLTKWQFPRFEVADGGFGIVFASDKDRVGPGGEVHTNFKLSLEGEYLALVEPDGVTIHSEFSPAYPIQQTAISWGTTGNGEGYFLEPTPGVANAELSAQGFVVEEVVADITRGFYSAPIHISLSTSAVDSQIYYTTNASEPSPANGTLYTGSIPVTTTTTLRAGAFRPDELPSKIMTQTYIFLDDVLNQPVLPAGYPSTWQPSVSADYAMASEAKIGTREEIRAALRDLPTLSLVMETNDWFNSSTDPAVGGIYSNSVIARGSAWERKVSAEFFDFPHGREIQLDAGMRIFGNASRTTSRKKHNMRLVFRRAYGESTLKFPLFGNGGKDDEVNSYLLRGQNGDSWFHPTASQRQEALYIRDQLARKLQGEMGQPSTKQDHIHVYVNGLYWGVFNTIERIEADSMVQEFGGKKEDWDVIKSSPNPGVEAVDGSVDPWNQVLAIAASDLSVPANYQAIQEYLDLENMIDWLLVNFYNGNSDWDTNNWQAARRRGPGETFKFFTWDSERTLLGTTVNNTTKNNAGRATRVHQELRANEDYRLRFADRIQRHFFNGGALSPEGVATTFQGFVDELRSPLVAESARWGDAQRSGNPYSVSSEWQTEVNFQTNTYIPERTATVLGQFRSQNLYPSFDAPVLSQFGGEVSNGYDLAITSATGEIRYTLDGSDPRNGGGLPYLGPIDLTEPVLVNARVREGGNWSALVSAAFYVGTEPASSDNLVISELNYHPQSDIDGEQFIELMNVGTLPVDLRGVKFSDGVESEFGGGTRELLWVISPGERILLVEDKDEFVLRYGTPARIRMFSGDLSNDGEQIVLLAGDGSVIQQFTYNDQAPWPKGADGKGFSLELVAPESRPDHSDGLNWRVSLIEGGTPGTGNALAFDGVAGVDSDGDGLDDLLEYAIGTESSDSSDGSSVMAVSLNGGIVSLRHPLRVGTDDVIVSVERSNNLKDWSVSDDLVVSAREVPVDGREWREYAGPSNSMGGVFYRLKVTLR